MPTVILLIMNVFDYSCVGTLSTGGYVGVNRLPPRFDVFPALSFSWDFLFTSFYFITGPWADKSHTGPHQSKLLNMQTDTELWSVCVVAQSHMPRVLLAHSLQQRFFFLEIITNRSITFCNTLGNHLNYSVRARKISSISPGNNSCWEKKTKTKHLCVIFFTAASSPISKKKEASLCGIICLTRSYLYLLFKLWRPMRNSSAYSLGFLNNRIHSQGKFLILFSRPLATPFISLYSF